MAQRKRPVHNRIKQLRKVMRYMMKMLDRYRLANCYFCGKSLLEVDLLDITVHHINGDHNDDRPENLSLSERHCHKSYHAKLILHGKIVATSCIHQ